MGPPIHATDDPVFTFGFVLKSVWPAVRTDLYALRGEFGSSVQFAPIGYPRAWTLIWASVQSRTIDTRFQANIAWLRTNLTATTAYTFNVSGMDNHAIEDTVDEFISSDLQTQGDIIFVNVFDGA